VPLSNLAINPQRVPIFLHTNRLPNPQTFWWRWFRNLNLSRKTNLIARAWPLTFLLIANFAVSLHGPSSAPLSASHSLLLLSPSLDTRFWEFEGNQNRDDDEEEEDDSDEDNDSIVGSSSSGGLALAQPAQTAPKVVITEEDMDSPLGRKISLLFPKN